MKYLKINPDLYVRKDSILEVTVTGSETDCEIRLLVAGAYGEPVIWQRFHAAVDSRRDALVQAEAEVNWLVCHELEEPEES